MVFRVSQDHVTTNVSTDRVSKVPNSSRALQLSATTGGEVDPGVTSKEDVTIVCSTEQDSRRPAWSQRMRESVSSRNLSSIPARKLGSDTLLSGVATTPQRAHRSPPSDYRSFSLTATGERLR